MAPTGVFSSSSPDTPSTDAQNSASATNTNVNAMPPTAVQPQPTIGTPTQPQAQAAQPVAAAPPPPKPGSFFRNMSHAFMGAVLGQTTEDGKRTGGIGGRTVPVTNPNTGEVTYQEQPQSVTQRLGEISRRMLSGLASIPDTPEHPVPIKGLGEGFVGAQKEQEAEQGKAKETEAENFKRAQDLKMQKYDIAYKNAATQNLAMSVLKLRDDLNPVIPESRELMQAVKNSPELNGLNVQDVTDQVRRDMMKDGHFSNSLIVPLGMQPLLGPDGNPIIDENGNAKSEMHWGIVSGDSSIMQHGNFVIPAGIASEIAEFGPRRLGDSAKSFTAGTSVPLGKFIKIMSVIDDERAKTVNGWAVPKVQIDNTDPANPKPLLFNSYNPDLPPRVPTYLPTEFQTEQGKEKQTEATTAENKAAAAKDYAEARNQLAQAAMYANGMNPLGNGTPSAPGTPAWNAMYNGVTTAIAKMPAEYRQVAVGISHQVNPQSMMALLTVANGDAKLKDIFPSSPRRGVPLITAQQAEPYVKLMNPQWSDGLAEEKSKAMKDFGSGKDGEAIGSFNRFLVHADELKRVSDNLARTNSPLLNMTIQEIQNKMMGQPGVPGLIAAIVAPRDEWQTFIKNGHASDLAENQEARKIIDPSSTVSQIIAALQVMAPQAIERLGTIDEQWSRQWGGHYPGLVTRESMTAAKDLGVDNLMQDYAPLVGMTVGGVYGNAPTDQTNPPQTTSPQTGQTVPAPQGATSEVIVNGKVVGHVVNNKYVALPVQQ